MDAFTWKNNATATQVNDRQIAKCKLQMKSNPKSEGKIKALNIFYYTFVIQKYKSCV